MTAKKIQFSSATVQFLFDSTIDKIADLAAGKRVIVITDENVNARHKKRFKAYTTIVIPAGEQHKTQQTVNTIVEQLVEIGAERSTFLVGIGGGVVTDITGYVAGIFMRGVSFGFVPTTILAMVDAAIGGKNGIDVGLHKNLVGLVRQPAFILYDYSLLKTLPQEEWVNGFAEVIKHACIKDKKMFEQLQQTKLNDFKRDLAALAKLIMQNAAIKIKVVQQDEFEQGERKLLNFGHTVGHAVETLYHIPHGHAISIGMGIASGMSQHLLGFKQQGEVERLLKQYGLPPHFEYDKPAVLQLVKSDKKKLVDKVHFILLKKIGAATIHPLSFDELEERL